MKLSDTQNKAVAKIAERMEEDYSGFDPSGRVLLNYGGVRVVTIHALVKHGFLEVTGVDTYNGSYTKRTNFGRNISHRSAPYVELRGFLTKSGMDHAIEHGFEFVCAPYATGGS